MLRVGSSVFGRTQIGNVVGKLQTMIGGAGCSVGVGKTQVKNGLPVGSTVGSLGAVCLNFYSLNNLSDKFSLEYAFGHT